MDRDIAAHARVRRLPVPGVGLRLPMARIHRPDAPGLIDPSLASFVRRAALPAPQFA